MQQRIFEDFTNYWRQAQQRLWMTPADFSAPANWSQLWAKNPWSNPGWTGLQSPSRKLPSDWALRSAEQIKKGLKPDAYLQASRYGTRTVHTCLDLQKQAWDYWFSLVTRSTQNWASLTQKTEAGSRKPRTAKRTRRKATATTQAPAPTAKKPALRAKAATASVQLELGSNDDLKKIAGIGPGLEKKLKQEGIVSYRQIAELSPRDIEHLETSIIKFSGRILRDNWIGQAKTLCAR